jgi:hypothetical protein
LAWLFCNGCAKHFTTLRSRAAIVWNKGSKQPEDIEMTDDNAIIDALKREIKGIKSLDPDLEEALYKWIDQTIGIPSNAPMGGVFLGVDALPVFMDIETGNCYATAVGFVGLLLRRLRRPILCGLAKYDSQTGNFLEAIPLRSWPDDWKASIKSLIHAAYLRTESDHWLFTLPELETA